MFRHLLQRGALFSVPLLLLALVVAGCGTSASDEDAPAAASKTGADCCGSHAPHPGHAPPGNEADAGASAELAKLPADDRAAAERQKTCPVTDAPLGSMGVPYKVELKGRTVFLCCAGCEGKLNERADEYLAKLERAERE